jgi:hypothetical protein
MDTKPVKLTNIITDREVWKREIQSKEGNDFSGFGAGNHKFLPETSSVCSISWAYSAQTQNKRSEPTDSLRLWDCVSQ